MQIINEYFDEDTNEYVYEFECTLEEEQRLNKFLDEQGLTLNRYVEKVLLYVIEHTDEVKQFALQNNNSYNVTMTYYFGY